ncbi:IS5 family transposase [Nocardioides sp.]|uniref:IS5 family transposase n=1 Tax=Nocardioides sp. TaxID=35761 RepID=UPI0039E6DD47
MQESFLMPSSCICACGVCPSHGPVLERIAKGYVSSSVTDAQWEVIDPLLPRPGNEHGKGGRNAKWPRRLVVDAIFYVSRNGIAWAALPAGFPPSGTVYWWFSAWARQGVWQRVHDALRDRLRVRLGRNPEPTAAVIDAQTVRASNQVHEDTSGYDAGKKTKGRKRHIAVDTNGLLLAIVVTAASIQDRDGAIRVLALLGNRFSKVRHVWVDGGYAGRFITLAKQVWSILAEVVKRSDDVKGFQLLHRRWVVERTFGWLMRHRRLVRDYETLPERHEAFVHIALIMTMSRQLTR